MFQKIKMPLIIIMTLFAGFFVYTQFLKKDVEEGVTKTPKENMASPEMKIDPVLLKINEITFDLSIFKDPVFLSLKDQEKKIEPEEKGRVNPFAPNAFSAVSTSTVNGPTFKTEPQRPPSGAGQGQQPAQNGFLF